MRGLALLFCLIALMALCFGCAGRAPMVSPASTVSPVEQTVMQRARDAVAPKLKSAKWVRYDEAEDAFYLRVDRKKSESAQDVVALAKVLEDEKSTPRLIVSGDGVTETMEPFRDSKLSRLEVVVESTYSHVGEAINAFFGFSPKVDLTLKSLDRLTVDAIEAQIPVTALTLQLHTSRDQYLYALPTWLGALAELESLRLIDEDGNTYPMSLDAAMICEAASRIPTIKTINGAPASEFTVAQAAGGAEAYKAHVDKMEADALNIRRLQDVQGTIDAAAEFYKDVRAKVEAGEYQESRAAEIKGTVMLDPGHGAFASMVALGKDYDGIPCSRFTLDPSEADTVIVVYPVYRAIGTYEDGSNTIVHDVEAKTPSVDAYETDTVVRVVDVKPLRRRHPKAGADHRE